jgi:flavin reductase (DIM6/NTAB) family NADH-FMN oxidoreductase RutF
VDHRSDHLRGRRNVEPADTLNAFKEWSRSDLLGLDRRYRRDLINRVSGSRTVWLLTSRSLDGTANIGLFSQVVHIGANPPLMGVLFRPKTDWHHSLDNIEETKLYGLHAVHTDRWQNAHATSFAFKASQSEFDECGWSEEKMPESDLPIIKDSLARIVLEPKEIVHIRSNQCRMVVGHILSIQIREDQLDSDQLPRPADWLNVSGLDLYINNQVIDTADECRKNGSSY